MELLSLFGWFVQKVIGSCFQIHFFKKKTQQSDGSCNVTSDSQLLYKLFKKNLFFPANLFEKYIVTKELCIARHDDETCFLPSSRCHIILIGDNNESPETLDAFCLSYNTWTVCTNFSSTDSVAKLLSRVVNYLILCRGQFTATNKTEHWKKMLSKAKKRLSRKKYKKHSLSSFQKIKSMQSSGSCITDRMEQVKKTKFELELMKIVDCFLVGHDKYTSNLVSSIIKSLQTNHILKSKWFAWISWYCKWYSHHNHQEPNCQRERNNQKDTTKCETNTSYTLVNVFYTPDRCHFPASCSLMLVRLW